MKSAHAESVAGAVHSPPSAGFDAGAGATGAVGGAVLLGTFAKGASFTQMEGRDGTARGAVGRDAGCAGLTLRPPTPLLDATALRFPPPS